MSRTVLAPITLKQNNYAVQAGDLTIALASDAINNNQFVATGKEILLVVNTDVSPHTFTISSVPDHLGRTQDIATYSVAASARAAIQMSVLEGWKQPDGNVYLSASDATLKFAVLRIS